MSMVAFRVDVCRALARTCAWVCQSACACVRPSRVAFCVRAVHFFNDESCADAPSYSLVASDPLYQQSQCVSGMDQLAATSASMPTSGSAFLPYVRVTSGNSLGWMGSFEFEFYPNYVPQCDRAMLTN